MKFDCFGKKQVEVVRRDNNWVVYYCGNEGKKRLAEDIKIPAHIAADDIATYLDDLLHEYASPNHNQVIQLS